MYNNESLIVGEKRLYRRVQFVFRVNEVCTKYVLTGIKIQLPIPDPDPYWFPKKKILPVQNDFLSSKVRTF